MPLELYVFKMIVVYFFLLLVILLAYPSVCVTLRKLNKRNRKEKKKITKHILGCYMIGKLQILFVGFLANGNATSDQTDK